MIQLRKEPLISGQCYHVFNRSIAGFVICNDAVEFSRLLELVNLLRFSKFDYRFAMFSKLTREHQLIIREKLSKENDLLVEIVAYCLMPTHFHMIIKQIARDGITKYFSRVLNSYSKYFNAKHRRQGPLWSSHFKSILVEDDQQLLHLSRYIHLNPTSADLISSPEKWDFSSIGEYLQNKVERVGICKYQDLLDISPKNYKKFILDQKDYQRQLSRIKSLLIDNYTG